MQNQIAPGARTLDLALALEMARARNDALDIMSELLPAAQAGMLAALSTGLPDHQ